MWDFRNRLAGQKIREPVRKQIMRKKNRTGKRLRLTPLILGGYAAFLGFGLIVIGLTEMKEGIGIVRLLIGLGMAGFGLLGIWDGVRDLVGPDKKPEQAVYPYRYIWKQNLQCYSGDFTKTVGKPDGK